MSSAKPLRVNEAEVATFTTTAPVAGSTWRHVPVIESPLPTRTQERDEALEGNSRGTDSMVYPTVQSSEYQFQTRIYTGTTGTEDTASAISPFMQRALEDYFGYDADTAFSGTTVAAASGPGQSSALKVTSASNISVGDILGFGGTDTQSPPIEFRAVTAISGTDVTLNADLTDADNYASGAIVYGGAQFVPTLGLRAKHHYLNVEENGRSTLIGPGKFTGLSITGMAAAGAARYNWTFQGNDFAAGVTPDTFTPNAFTGSPIVTKGMQIYVGTVATQVAELGVEFNFGHEWKMDGTATHGRAGIELVNVGGSRVSFKEYHVAQRETDWEAQSGVSVFGAAYVGSTRAAGSRGAIAFFIPNATLVTTRDKLNNQTSLSTVFEARDPTSAQVTAGLTSSIYYCVFGGV
jgi:hypothetical protein